MTYSRAAKSASSAENMSRIQITVNVIDGTKLDVCPLSINKMDNVERIRKDLQTHISERPCRFFYRNLLIAEKSPAIDIGLTHGSVILCICKKSLAAGTCKIRNLSINSKVTVLITDHYREKGIFLVADDSAYGVPVCFLGSSVESFRCGDVVSATYVGAKLRKGRTRVEYIVLDGAAADPGASICALAKPVCLLMRRSGQV